MMHSKILGEWGSLAVWHMVVSCFFECLPHCTPNLWKWTQLRNTFGPKWAPIYTHRIHVWYIKLHLFDFYGECVTVGNYAMQRLIVRDTLQWYMTYLRARHTALLCTGWYKRLLIREKRLNVWWLLHVIITIWLYRRAFLDKTFICPRCSMYGMFTYIWRTCIFVPCR